MYQFTFPPIVQECSLFSTPSPAFIVCRFFVDGHSDQCEMISHCGFDLHFSNSEWCFRRIGISSSLNGLIVFSCEAIWSWAFASWEIFDHSFNFSACNWVVHNFYFFLVQSWRLNFSKNLSISSRLSIILPYSCS